MDVKSRLFKTNDCSLFKYMGRDLVSCLKLLHFAGSGGFDPLRFSKHRYDLLIAHKEELGQLITLEQGKPLKEAIGEVDDSIYI